MEQKLITRQGRKHLAAVLAAPDSCACRARGRRQPSPGPAAGLQADEDLGGPDALRGQLRGSTLTRS